MLPQEPAHLVLCYLMSLFSLYVVQQVCQHTGIVASLVFFKLHSKPQVALSASRAKSPTVMDILTQFSVLSVSSSVLVFDALCGIASSYGHVGKYSTVRTNQQAYTPRVRPCYLSVLCVNHRRGVSHFMLFPVVQFHL